MSKAWEEANHKVIAEAHGQTKREAMLNLLHELDKQDAAKNPSDAR